MTIKTKPATEAYRDNWDAIFKAEVEEPRDIIPIYQDERKTIAIATLEEAIDRLCCIQLPLMTPPDSPLFAVFFACKDTLTRMMSELKDKK